MKQLLTLIFALTFLGNLSAQHEPIQPYEELGIKVKVLTLSNGKYQESFPNDTLQRIGSVIFNRVTGEVVSVVISDTLYGEYDLKPEVVSRWLSPDPLAAENANWSPYAAMNDNPIIFVDPDGRDAILSIRPGENGGNGSITVRLVFNSTSGISDDAKQAAVSSFEKTWGNGRAASDGGSSFVGNTFEGIEIDGLKYDVTYQLEFNEGNSANSPPAPGENSLTVLNENGGTSNYGGGTLNYKPSQEKGAMKGTTFGHEIAHAMGIGHNSYKDENGTISISSYSSKRDVNTQDIVNSVQPAVGVTNGQGGTVILTTGRGTLDINTVSTPTPNGNREAQYQTIGN